MSAGFHEQDIIGVARALGGCSKQYQRERRKAIRAVLSEIDSPPRVTAARELPPELEVIPGLPLDLTTADFDGRLWDFDDVVMRDRARIRTAGESWLLLGSPCVLRVPHGMVTTFGADSNLACAFIL